MKEEQVWFHPLPLDNHIRQFILEQAHRNRLGVDMEPRVIDQERRLEEQTQVVLKLYLMVAVGLLRGLHSIQILTGKGLLLFNTFS